MLNFAGFPAPRKIQHVLSALSSLNRPPPRHLQHNAGNIVRERRSQEQYRAGRFFRRPGPSQRDEQWGHLAHLVRYPKLDLLAFTLHLLCILFCSRQARLDKPKTGTIYLHVITPPLLCQRLRQTRYACLGRRIIHLPCIPIHTRDRGHIHHLPRIGPPIGSLLFFRRATHELRGLAQATERCRRMHIDHRIPLFIGHILNHTIPCVPALLTMISIPPKLSSVALINCAGNAGSVTSPATTTALPPALRMAAAVSSAGAGSRSLTTINAPSAPNILAVAAPIPRPAPVKLATFTSINAIKSPPSR